MSAAGRLDSGALQFDDWSTHTHTQRGEMQRSAELTGNLRDCEILRRIEESRGEDAFQTSLLLPANSFYFICHFANNSHHSSVESAGGTSAYGFVRKIRRNLAPIVTSWEPETAYGYCNGTRSIARISPPDEGMNFPYVLKLTVVESSVSLM